MKRIYSFFTNRRFFICLLISGLIFTIQSCRDDLLNQTPTLEVGSSTFWKTEEDASYALYGAYADIRPLFDRDYYFDGHGEYVRVHSGTNSTTDGDLRLGDAYRASNYNPSGYAGGSDKMFRYLYGGVNRTNYVIENVKKMLPGATDASRVNLEAIIGEARLLRGMIYFRLISMWGDVPYYSHIVYDKTEVETLSRMPITQIKDSIMNDFTYAIEKLPTKASAVGRASKPAALSFRGKLQLYWACWNRFGWPELETFTPNASEATTAYAAAVADFKKVIEDYGLTLYKNGEPGECDEVGKAEKLPNYYYLFTPVANGDPEHIMVFTHGGTGTDQGEALMREFGGRNHENAQGYTSPRYEIADRYQSIITGDFCPKLIPMNPSTNPAARTTPNSAVNPQSYADRDYRMKSSIMWDYEMSMGMMSLKSTGWVPFIFNTWNQNVTIDGVTYVTYNPGAGNWHGYVFRKFLRNTPGDGRNDGSFNWPVMRLADVYLMYAEATNAISGPQEDAIALVNKIRHRGNLPALKPEKTANADVFFEAIEQERIIELYAEGHRGFDLRRWRAIERVWCPPYDNNGVWRIDTYGANRYRYFQNASEKTYQQCYIFKIPESERERNPNLTQNKCWL